MESEGVQDPVEHANYTQNSARKCTACRKRGDQESEMDHTNDPMERVSERVVSRSTLRVACCSEHAGKALRESLGLRGPRLKRDGPPKRGPKSAAGPDNCSTTKTKQAI